MPITLEPVVGTFRGPSSGVEIGSPFRLPRFFPYKDCMVLVDMKSKDIAVDHASWNDIVQKAPHVLHACVQGETHQSGGSEVAGYRSGIAISFAWNFPEMDSLASLNRPELEVEVPGAPYRGTAAGASSIWAEKAKAFMIRMYEPSSRGSSVSCNLHMRDDLAGEWVGSSENGCRCSVSLSVIDLASSEGNSYLFDSFHGAIIGPLHLPTPASLRQRPFKYATHSISPPTHLFPDFY